METLKALMRVGVEWLDEVLGSEVWKGEEAGSLVSL